MHFVILGLAFAVGVGLRVLDYREIIVHKQIGINPFPGKVLDK